MSTIASCSVKIPMLPAGSLFRVQDQSNHNPGRNRSFAVQLPNVERVAAFAGPPGHQGDPFGRRIRQWLSEFEAGAVTIDGIAAREACHRVGKVVGRGQECLDVSSSATEDAPTIAPKWSRKLHRITDAMIPSPGRLQPFRGARSSADKYQQLADDGCGA
jgi:hypothetical protein